MTMQRKIRIAALVLALAALGTAVAVSAKDKSPVDPAKVQSIIKRQGDRYSGNLLTPEEYEYLRRAEQEAPELLFRPERSGYLFRLRASNSAPANEQMDLFRVMSEDRYAFEDAKIYPYSVKAAQKILDTSRREKRPLSPQEAGYLTWAFSTPRGPGYTPLDEMSADDRYKGEDGGLYGGGKNEPPPEHHAAALAQLKKIQPLDAEGNPSPDGKIVLLSIGMSNASELFRGFKSFADRDPRKSPQVVIVDGALPGQLVTQYILDSPYRNSPRAPWPTIWRVVEDRLREAGVTTAQVQAAWVKQVHCPNSSEPWDKTFDLHTRRLHKDLARLMGVLIQRCPNLRIAYLSSRVYGGYAAGYLHPEPFAYETAFAIRWLIQDQIKGRPEVNYDAARGPVKSPLVLWGPYLWADGMRARKSDGLTWQPIDILDGTHKSYTGIFKCKDLMLSFFTGSPYAAPWFTKAAHAKSDIAPVKVIKDVAYGPHGVRNLMDFYLPQTGTTPRPLVICIHGGGWMAGDKQRYAWLGEAMARKGFAAVSITYRFAPAWRAPTQMDDVQRAVRWLRKNAAHYGLDPDRFGAIGESAGAHLASYLALADTRDNSDPELARYSSRVQCVVDCYGPVDMVGMMRSASAPIVKGFLGKPLEGHEEDYQKASAISCVKGNPPPFLILHGTKDIGTRPGQVPIEQSIEFCQKLRQAAGDATLIKLEGADHGFMHTYPNPYAEKTLAAAIEFFTKHLMLMN